jgi:hypothetical protein
VHAAYPTHHILLYLIPIIFGKENRLWSSSSCKCPACFYFLPLMSKYSPQHQLPINRDLCSSRIMTDQVLLPYKIAS